MRDCQAAHALNDCSQDCLNVPAFAFGLLLEWYDTTSLFVYDEFKFWLCLFCEHIAISGTLLYLEVLKFPYWCVSSRFLLCVPDFYIGEPVDVHSGRVDDTVAGAVPAAALSALSAAEAGEAGHLQVFPYSQACAGRRACNLTRHSSYSA